MALMHHHCWHQHKTKQSFRLRTLPPIRLSRLSKDRRHRCVQPQKTHKEAYQVGRRKLTPIAMTRPQEPPLSRCRYRSKQATDMRGKSPWR